MFDMMKMMGKMKEVQARMKEAQDNLVKMQAHGESGAGMVKATVNGKKQLVAIDVDPSLMKSEDKIILQDLIVAAVNKANEEAEGISQRGDAQKYGRATAEYSRIRLKWNDGMSRTAVVILNYNGEKLLHQFLPSVLQHFCRCRNYCRRQCIHDQSIPVT